MTARTAIFGEVEICGEYQDEAEARAAGYVFDAHAYRVNAFGSIEPVSWKVLARAESETEWAFIKTWKGSYEHDENGGDRHGGGNGAV